MLQVQTILPANTLPFQQMYYPDQTFHEQYEMTKNMVGMLWGAWNPEIPLNGMNVQNEAAETVIYTELSTDRFNDFRQD